MDEVGALYATAFRDLLAKSPRFVETYESEVKNRNGEFLYPNWNVRVVSVDPSQDNVGISTALSVVILLGSSTYMDQQVQTCGRNRVSGCASDTLARLDNLIQSLRH